MSAPITMQPGLHYDLSFDEYLASPGLSSTFARLLTNHVPAKALALRDKEPTGAMRLGTIVHSIILGDDTLDSYAVDGLTVIPGDGRTKAVKEARAAAEAAGLDVVTATEYETRAALHQQLTDMLAAVQAHPEIAPLIAGDHEVSAFWQDEDTGVWLRARFDILGDGQPIDFKTTIDASRRGFTKAIAKYGYHQQAELYCRALKALGVNADPTFRFIAQETSAPYLVNLHRCDELAMEVARALNDRAIRIYAECTRTGEWPGYSIDPDPLSLPSYYYYDHEDALPDEWRLGQDLVIS